VDRVTAEVRRFVHTHDASRPGVVAVSGGADSVALLRALVEIDVGSLIVAHVNHQLRGSESDADEAFVSDLAAKQGFPCRTTRIDVQGLAAGANLEATARRVRYSWFADVASEVGANWVATGHTADDQAETVLHRLIRGTGLQGLRGIAARKDNPSPNPLPEVERGLSPLPASGRGRGRGSSIIRPLLRVTRAEVLDYLASLQQPFLTDSTNADPRFTRNRIRAELLPLLRTFNPEVVAVLGRHADQAGEAFEVLTADAAALLAEAELPRAADWLILDAATLAAAHPYRVREALRLVWLREVWPTDRMTADHWNRLVTVVKGDLPAADFPAGVTARHVGRVVQLGRRQ
jgi:tRNA(Ile)-lysidine synthase